MLSATCYLLPLITVRWLVLVGVSTSLTRLSLVLSHTARRSLNPGEKNEASFTTHLSASAATAVGLGCLRRTDRRSVLQIKIIPSEMHHQHGLRHTLNVTCSATTSTATFHDGCNRLQLCKTQNANFVFSKQHCKKNSRWMKSVIDLLYTVC